MLLHIHFVVVIFWLLIAIAALLCMVACAMIARVTGRLVRSSIRNVFEVVVSSDSALSRD